VPLTMCRLRAQTHFTRGAATVTSTNPPGLTSASTGDLDSILDASDVAEIEIAVDALTREDVATTD
jgi:hypothetical protein